jgi:TRAP-type C4-dicarboxylate transport system substrate-binding protein
MGDVAIQSIKALGATPVSNPPPEAYSALERGIVEGCWIPLGMVNAFKLHEVLNYFTVCSTQCGIGAVMMNLDTWNSLPPDIQQIFDELSPWAQQLYTERSNAEDEATLARVKELGKTVIYLSPEERAKFAAVTKPVVENWMKEMDARGLPGTAIVEEARRLAAEL